MISFNYESPFKLTNENDVIDWITKILVDANFQLGEINYIFCDDDYLHKLNIEFLNHDTLTDVISFDNTVGKLIGGDIFISIERVKDNASDFNVSFDEELKRVMIHGVLHFMGFKDKTKIEKELMRKEENKAIDLFKG